MKIENLTKEQTSRFQEFINKWTAIGLSTAPANRREALEIRSAFEQKPKSVELPQL